MRVFFLYAFGSVWILSAETRCSALAITMHTSFTLNDLSWQPPFLPPIAPTTLPPPPPPSPPSPNPPPTTGNLRRVEVPEVVLSTYFLPQLRIDPSYQIVGGSVVGLEIDPDVAPSELGVTTNNNATRNRLIAEYSARGRFSSHLAACTTQLRDAPLPCRTSVLPERCLDGSKACSTAEHNGEGVFMELDFHATAQDGTYPHVLVFKIPPVEEYGRLLFHALGDDTQQENRGWVVELFDGNHTLIETIGQPQPWNLGSPTTEWSDGLTTIQHALFPAITSDEAYAEASKARFIRVALIGQLRQIWLVNIELFIRDVPEKLV